MIVDHNVKICAYIQEGMWQVSMLQTTYTWVTRASPPCSYAIIVSYWGLNFIIPFKPIVIQIGNKHIDMTIDYSKSGQMQRYYGKTLSHLWLVFYTKNKSCSYRCFDQVVQQPWVHFIDQGINEPTMQYAMVHIKGTTYYTNDLVESID